MAIGSWGTPEFGITEAISNWFGQGRTSQGGSNLFGNQNQTTLVPSGQGSFVPLGSNAAYNPQGLQTTGGGQVLGAGKGGIGTNGQQQQTQQQQQTNPEDAARKAQNDADARARGEISAGYDTYFQTLDQMLNTGLPGQQAAQTSIAASQGTQAENTLGAAKEQGLADLNTYGRQVETNKVKTLQDLAENIRALFRSGQSMIGAKGAGDSSAVNQYSYALTKEGNRSRGNVMTQATELNNQIQDKEFKLKNTYNTELANIKEQVNQKTQEIAQWFSEQQNNLLMAKGQGAIQKGESLANLSKQALTQAMNQVSALQQEAANKRLLLDQWAASNSKTIGELKSNLGQISQGQQTGVNNPGMANLQGGTSGALNMSQYGFSNNPTAEDKQKQSWLGNINGVTDAMGNPITKDWLS